MNKVLVVEDDFSTAELIKFTLGTKDISVDIAGDGGEAIKKVRTNTPDLIVLDIMLPTMDGYQVCELIKHNVLWQGIPIIMLSAKVQREDISKGLEKGADEYMTKPFEPNKLMERILFFLSKKSKKGGQQDG
jgi:two-component system alkaline phosphatase synthesis response regulator PhoP